MKISLNNPSKQIISWCNSVYQALTPNKQVKKMTKHTYFVWI